MNVPVGERRHVVWPAPSVPRTSADSPGNDCTKGTYSETTAALTVSVTKSCQTRRNCEIDIDCSQAARSTERMVVKRDLLIVQLEDRCAEIKGSVAELEGGKKTQPVRRVGAKGGTRPEERRKMSSSLQTCTHLYVSMPGVRFINAHGTAMPNEIELHRCQAIQLANRRGGGQRDDLR